MDRNTRGLVLFLLLSFLLAWPMAFGMEARASSRAWDLISTALLAVPALCALFVRAFVERSGLRGVGLRWGRGRYYLLAWLLFPALAAAGMGLAVLTHQAEFDRWMTELMVRIKLTYPNQPLDPNAARVGFTVFSFTLGMLPTALAGLITEFAWRGYLLMRLLPRVGRGWALVLTGAAQGVWMAPFVLLPNRLTPYLYPEHRLLGVLLMVGFSTLSGVVLGWLRLASGSLFPAAVGVGAMNGPARTALFLLRGRNDVTTGLTGLLGQAMLLLVILGLWRTGALPRAFDRQGEDDAREPLPQQGQQ